jgi:hypothetical protein
LCDRVIATNFGIVVILVDSCAVIVIYFVEEKKEIFACGGIV